MYAVKFAHIGFMIITKDSTYVPQINQIKKK